MIISSDNLKRVYEFVNTLKLDNCIKFARDLDGSLSVLGQDTYTSFVINTDIKWDMDINYFCFKMPNLTFMEGDVEVLFDVTTDNIIFKNGSTISSVLNNTNDFYNSSTNFSNINLENNTLNICSLEETILIFKELSTSISFNSDNFTSGIYVDNDAMFTTDKITACWYHNSLFNSINYSAVIDSSIIHLLDKIKNFNPESFSMYLEKDKNITLSFTVDSFDYTCLKSLLNYNYPNFRNLFSRFSFDISLLINRQDFEDIIMSILKFDNKCNSIYINIFENKSMTIQSSSIDNTKHINFKMNYDVEKGDVFNKIIKINPIYLKNSLGHSKSFLMNVSKEENKPIQIISSDEFEHYIHTMSV